MKAVAVILALAVITGCNARAVLNPDAAVSQWQDTVNRFTQYITDLTQQADGTVQNLKASQLSRELDTLITDTMAELTTYRDDLQSKVESSAGQASQDMQLLVNRLQKDMVDAKERSTEYLGELKTMMEQNTEDARNRFSTYTHKLKKRLNKDTEEIINTAATYMGEVQSRAAQNLDAVKGQVEPFIQQAGTSATEKLSDVSVMLQKQAEELSQQAEGIKTQLEASAQELRVTLEGKIEELRELIVPYATKIREHFEMPQGAATA